MNVTFLARVRRKLTEPFQIMFACELEMHAIILPDDLKACVQMQLQRRGTRTLEAIANHLGSHREVITRMLRYFQSEGMLKLSRGAIEIVDMQKLEELCDK